MHYWSLLVCHTVQAIRAFSDRSAAGRPQILALLRTAIGHPRLDFDFLRPRRARDHVLHGGASIRARTWPCRTAWIMLRTKSASVRSQPQLMSNFKLPSDGCWCIAALPTLPVPPNRSRKTLLDWRPISSSKSVAVFAVMHGLDCGLRLLGTANSWLMVPALSHSQSFTHLIPSPTTTPTRTIKYKQDMTGPIPMCWHKLCPWKSASRTAPDIIVVRWTTCCPQCLWSPWGNRT